MNSNPNVTAIAKSIIEITEVVTHTFTNATGETINGDPQYVSEVLKGSLKVADTLSESFSDLQGCFTEVLSIPDAQDETFWFQAFGGEQHLKTRRCCFVSAVWYMLSSTNTPIAEFECVSETYLMALRFPGATSYRIYNGEIAGSLFRKLVEHKLESSSASSIVKHLCAIISETNNPLERDLIGEHKNVQDLFFRVVTSEQSQEVRSAVTGYVKRNHQDKEFLQILLTELVNQNIGPAQVLRFVEPVLLATTDEKVSVLGLTFLQHIVVKVSQHKQPDSAGVTIAPLVEVAYKTLSNYVPVSSRFGTCVRYASFLERTTKSRKDGQRISAVQFGIGFLMDLPGFLAEQAVCEEWREYEEELFKSILARVHDRVAAVRVAALGCMMRYLKTSSSSPGARCRHRLGQIRDELSRTVQQDDKPNVRRTALQALLSMIGLCEEDSSDFRMLVDTLASRTQDSSVAVRKTVLSSLNSLVDEHSNSQHVPMVWMKTILALVPDRERSIENKCIEVLRSQVLSRLVGEGDPTLVWRALGALSEQDLDRFRDALMKLCLSGDLPDAPKLVAAAQQGIEAMLGSGPESLDQRGRTAASWLVLDFCCGGSSLSELDRTPSPDGPSVAAALPLPRRSLVQLRRETVPHVDMELVLEAWRTRGEWGEHDGEEASGARTHLKVGTLKDWVHTKLVNVLIGLAPRIPAGEASELADSLLQVVSVLDADPHVTAQYVRLLVALCRAKSADLNAARAMMAAWITSTLGTCHSILQGYTLRGLGIQRNQRDSAGDEELMVGRALHLVGELAMVDFDPNEQDAAADPSAVAVEGASGVPSIPDKTVCLVQALTLPTFRSAAAKISAQEDLSGEERQSGPSQSLIDGREEGSNALSTGNQDSNASSTGNQDSNASSAGNQDSNASSTGNQDETANSPTTHNQQELPIPTSIRAHALVAVGKFCIRSIHVAKAFIPVLIRELSDSTRPGEEILQSNILVVLGDLCKRYTSMIDGHMDQVSACLLSGAPMVRRTCMVLLVGLLQEDYIKFKGLLLFRFLLCLAESEADPQLERIAKYSLVNVFLAKQPVLFHVNFVETLFVLNDARFHPKHNPLGAEALAAHAARAGPAQRLRIYEFLLQHMTPHQRLEATNKLAKDVFGALLDGLLPPCPQDIDATARLFADAVAVLRSPHLRLRTRGGAAEEEDSTRRQSMGSTATGTSTASALEISKGRVLGKLAQKNVAENLVPTALSAHRLLQRHRSPLLEHAGAWLRHLLRAHPEQILPTLKQPENRVLLEELQFDQRQEDRAKRASLGSVASLGAESTPAMKRSRSLPHPLSARRTPPTARKMSPLVSRALSNRKVRLGADTPVPRLSTAKKAQRRRRAPRDENLQHQRVVKLSFEG